MKSRITSTVALAAIMSAGAVGAAHAQEGWYGRADVGYSIAGNLDIGSTLPGFGGNPQTKGDWYEGVGLGYAFQNGFRVEGELSHRFNQLQDTTLVDHGGDIHAWSGMVNLYYDFNRTGSFRPYLGIGGGGAELVANASDAGSGGSFNDSDTVWAYQGLAGIAFDVSPQMAIDVGYRYYKAAGGNFAGTPALNSPYSADYTDQAITVGLRYTFEGPPPPPPPPPPYVAPPPPPPPPQVAPACPESDFVVYFEWDRSNLNQAANDTIDAAVARARSCNLTAATVVGHTDTSGSAAYNMGLSNRRASVVRDALVSRGMSAGEITTNGVGETDLAKPTRDGVREPLNRRTAVTITFH